MGACQEVGDWYTGVDDHGEPRIMVCSWVKPPPTANSVLNAHSVAKPRGIEIDVEPWEPRKLSDWVGFFVGVALTVIPALIWLNC